jgi:hypothetical protein
LHIDHEIGPHCWAKQDATTVRLVRLARLSIDRYDHRPMTLEPKRHDAR